MDVNDPMRDPFLLARCLEANPLAAAYRLGEVPDPASALPAEAALATAMRAPEGMGQALLVRETLGRLSAPGRYDADFVIPADLAHLMAPYDRTRHVDDNLIRGIDGHIHTVLRGTSSARTIRAVATYGEVELADDRVDAIGHLQRAQLAVLTAMGWPKDLIRERRDKSGAGTVRPGGSHRRAHRRG